MADHMEVVMESLSMEELLPKKIELKLMQVK